MNVESGGGHFRNFEYLSLAREFLTTSSLTGGGNLRVELIKGQTIRKVMGGEGIFEPQEFFFVIKFLV